MPYGFEIRTKQGKLVAENANPYPTLKDAKEVGRLHLKDKRTPVGSKLKVFKYSNSLLDDPFGGF